MHAIRFVALASECANHYRTGGVDAHGQPPQRAVADSGGLPCRHCLTDIEPGQPYLTLAHRPFPVAQPYAETGPIFIHAEPCTRYPETDAVPAMFRARSHLMVRGYDRDDRIVYDSAARVPTGQVAQSAASLLQRDEIVYLHFRSASTTCFQCRVERAKI